MENSFSESCRICSKVDAESYISIFDNILNVQITTLILELTQQHIWLNPKVSKFICTDCAKGLRIAIKLKRMFVRNEFVLKHPGCDLNDQNDPFFVDDELEFIEKPIISDPKTISESKLQAEEIAETAVNMKIEFIVEDEDPDPLFDDNVNLEYTSQDVLLQQRLRLNNENGDVFKRHRLVTKVEELETETVEEENPPAQEITADEDEEAYGSDDSDESEFFINQELVDQADDEEIEMLDSNKPEEDSVFALEADYEGMDVSDDEEYILDDWQTPPSPTKRKVATRKPKAPFSVELVKQPANKITRSSVLDMPLSDLKYSCCMCRHICENEADLKIHLLEHPERVRRRSYMSLYQKAITDLKTKAGVECVKCCRIVDPMKMTYHLKYHYVRKKFVCGGCGERFGFYSEMTKHEKKCIVLGKKRSKQEFVCSICEKVLMSRATLKQHIYNFHEMTEEDKVKFKCNLCGKGFASPKNLKEHVKTHTQTATFPCTMCTKSFKTKINLEIHLRVHYNERIYKCNYCEKSYIHYSDRHRHQLSVHTGERPHKCPICGEGFVKKYTCTLHVRKVHTGERPFACDECDEAFYQNSTLKSHKDRKHNKNSKELPIILGD